MSPEVYVVGVIADTHGLVRPGIAAAFAGVQLILHAGDVGGAAVLAALSAVARVEAVYGNVDDPHDPLLAMISARRRPIRSAIAPVTGAEPADAYVRNPRNRPEANVEPPSS